jgi:hypothetical protein
MIADKEEKHETYPVLFFFLILAAAAGPAVGERKAGFGHAFSFMGGASHREDDTEPLRGLAACGWEGWPSRNRIFGFYFDLGLAPEKDNALGMMSYGVSVGRGEGRRFQLEVPIRFD